MLAEFGDTLVEESGSSVGSARIVEAGLGISPEVLLVFESLEVEEVELLLSFIEVLGFCG